MNLHWVGGDGLWDASSTTHWSLTSGGAGGAGNPTLSDNAIFDSGSASGNYTVTIDPAGATCLDWSVSAPSSGNLFLNGGGGSSFKVYGSITLYAGFNSTGTILNWLATTSVNLTTNGTALPAYLQINGTGTFNLLDAVNNAGFFQHYSGTLNTNNLSITGTGFTSNGSVTRTLNLGSTTINAKFVDISGTSLTLSSGTSSIVVTSGYAQPCKFGPYTFYNVSIGGYVDRSCNMILTGNIVANTFSVNGNSILNRILVQSDKIGVQRTITAATVGTSSNVDFLDIVGAGAGSWNLSSISGGSGNCGNNSGITFTTAQTNYWKHGATASVPISTAGNWYLATNGGGGAGRYPLPQDSAIFDGNSIPATTKTIVQDMPRIGNISWATVTNSPSWDTQNSPAVPLSFFGNVTLGTGLNTGQALGYSNFTLCGRGNFTIKSAGQLWIASFILACPGGTYSQQDNFDNSGFYAAFGPRGAFRPVAGTWNANGFNFTTSAMEDSFLGANTSAAILTIGSGIWEINGSDTTFTFSQTGIWQLTTTSISDGSTSTGTIYINDSTATAKTMRTIGQYYPNIHFGGSGAGSFSIIFSGYGHVIKTTTINNTGGANVSLTNSMTYGGFHTVDFTGFNGTWSGYAFLFDGDLTMSTGMTITATGQLYVGAASGTQTITSNGKTFLCSIFYSGAQLNLADILNVNNTFTISNGNFASNSHDIYCTQMIINRSSTKTVDFGSSPSTVYLTGYGSGSGQEVFIANTGAGTFTFLASNATFKVTNTNAIQAVFAGSGLSFGTIWNGTSGSGFMIITGNNTFNVMKSDAGRHTRFYSGSVTQVATPAGFQMAGVAGNLVYLEGISSGYGWNIICVAGGIISTDYVSIQDSFASTAYGASWYAGGHSTNVSGNTVWVFGAPPVASSKFFVFFK